MKLHLSTVNQEWSINPPNLIPNQKMALLVLLQVYEVHCFCLCVYRLSSAAGWSSRHNVRALVNLVWYFTRSFGNISALVP
jgi:hypothetical protein